MLKDHLKEISVLLAETGNWRGKVETRPTDEAEMMSPERDDPDDLEMRSPGADNNVVDNAEIYKQDAEAPGFDK